MPLIRVDMIEGRSPDEIKELLDATHRMLVSVLKSAEDRCGQLRFACDSRERNAKLQARGIAALIMTQRDQWIDVGRAARGEIGGNHGYETENRRSADESHRISCFEA